jgi:uncharacterized protein
VIYNKLGKTGELVSVLGFGCMRLPVLDGNMARIDEEKASAMIRKAIDSGVNYIDTAWSYHGSVMGQKGESEPFVGRVLKNGYREKVKLATKLPSWLINSRQDMDFFLNEQLIRLQTETVDCYLIHALDAATWKSLKALGIRDFLDTAIKEGKIRVAGFSFHDNFDLFREIVDSYNWSFCQIQYNYLDEAFQAGTAGMLYAAGKGLGVVAMEPLRGGKLARNLPEDISGVFENSGIKRTPAQWALRWVWNHPEISLLLSGMNEPSDVMQNLEAAEEGFPNSLKPDEIYILEKVRSLYGKRIKVGCTSCGYCMPCPSGVNIPGNFSYFNDYFLFDTQSLRETTVRLYNHYIKPGERPSACIECGQCEEKCPQAIQVISELKNVERTFR